ncbi:Nucleoside-diphosphate-sugar epimerase [Candidatus Nitrosarchaeum limnium SFB1]|jgi:UDP-glucose 4-epimerase|uniref:Nucleoside-diphosphate-sugar epimerase n=1 Tax=Candidatus Nitrosarchaeum limnium SFB1 TaxID=886738 RepID=F3KN15_9ARCH|nr:Nucleoside-diphosphate-sugar epimerase [Candidatus Nitrosarchaeum limnium SFB1]
MGKILVTGSSGFIGKKIVKRLDKSKIIIDSNNSERINLQNREQVMKLDSADTVIHLGGKTPQNELKWSEYFDNNVIGTLNVLEYCIQKKVKRLIYVSSYVYGNPKYCPVDEKHPINPHNAYTESKYLGERLCEFYCNKSELNLIILRPFNIFGESMREGFLITNLIDSVKTGEKITVINKNSKRDFLYVDDFVDLIIKLIDYDFKFEIFNVGAGKSYSFEEIIKKIEKITSQKINVNYQENKEIFIDNITSDISKIKNIINWQPKIKFNEGLEKILKTQSY